MTMVDNATGYRNQSAAGSGDEIDFRRVFRTLAEGRIFILVTVVVSLLIGLLFLRVAPPAFTASMLVMPAGEEASPQVLGQYRGLASTIGIQLPNAPAASPFQQFVSTLTSTRLAGKLARDHGMLQVIYKSRWDADSQKWLAPGGIKSSITMTLNWLAGLPAWNEPSADTLAGYLRENLAIRSDDKTGLVTVRYTAGDPEFAAAFLRLVHQESDNLVRRDALERTQSNVDYLRSQLQKTTALETRNALIELMTAQENKLMLMSSDLPFAAIFVDPPFPPSAPSYPRPMLTLVLAAFGGLIFGCLIVLGWGMFVGYRKSAPVVR